MLVLVIAAEKSRLCCFLRNLASYFIQASLCGPESNPDATIRTPHGSRFTIPGVKCFAPVLRFFCTPSWRSVALGPFAASFWNLGTGPVSGPIPRSSSTDHQLRISSPLPTINMLYGFSGLKPPYDTTISNIVSPLSLGVLYLMRNVSSAFSGPKTGSI
jgi:hypothetical protein